MEMNRCSYSDVEKYWNEFNQPLNNWNVKNLQCYKYERNVL